MLHANSFLLALCSKCHNTYCTETEVNADTESSYLGVGFCVSFLVDHQKPIIRGSPEGAPLKGV